MGNIFSNESDEDHEEEIEELNDNNDSFFGGWFETTEPPAVPQQKKKVKNVKFDTNFTFDDEGLRKQQKTRKRRTGQKNKTRGRRY